MNSEMIINISNDPVLLDTEVVLKKGINIFAGENGSGKTLFAYVIATKTKNKNLEKNVLEKNKLYYPIPKNEKKSEKYQFTHWNVDNLILNDLNVRSIKYISAFALVRFENFFLNVFISPKFLWNKFNELNQHFVKQYSDEHSRSNYDFVRIYNGTIDEYFSKVYNQNFFLILKQNRQNELLDDTATFVQKHYGKKFVKPDEYFQVWIQFYSDICKKYLFGKENLLLYLNYCLFYFSFKYFLENATKLVNTKNDEEMQKSYQEIANNFLQHFHKQENYFNPVNKMKEMNQLFVRMRLDFKCEIKEISKDVYTESTFKLVFSSNNSSKIRSPNDFSTGEKNLVSIIDCFLWFELKKESKNIILFIDEFDAFLNPIQAKEVVTKLNKLKLKVYFILVSQRPITITQLNSKFNYLLAEKRKISNSTQDKILKKLLKDTPDLNVYKSKQLHILIEGDNKGSLDFRLYNQILKTFFKTKRNYVQFLAVGEKDSIETTFKNSNSLTSSKNWFGVVDNDNKNKVSSNNLFICQKYYSVENFLFSPPILINFLDSINNTKVLNNPKKRQEYIEEIANKIWKKGEQTFKDKDFVREKTEAFKFIQSNKNKSITLDIPSFLVCAKVKDYCNIYLKWFKEKLCSNKNLMNWNSKEFTNKIIDNFTILPIELKKMFDNIFASSGKQKINKQK